MAIYFIDGKKFDTNLATLLYFDGTFSNEKEYYYKTQAGNYVWLGISMWQLTTIKNMPCKLNPQ